MAAPFKLQVLNDNPVFVSISGLKYAYQKKESGATEKLKTSAERYAKFLLGGALLPDQIYRKSCYKIFGDKLFDYVGKVIIRKREQSVFWLLPKILKW